MKIYGVLLCLLCLGTGCRNREVSSRSRTEEIQVIDRFYHFHVIEVDGCQYLFLELDRNNPHEGFGFFSHRGNCSNPIHIYDSVAFANSPPLDTAILRGAPVMIDN